MNKLQSNIIVERIYHTNIDKMFSNKKCNNDKLNKIKSQVNAAKNKLDNYDADNTYINEINKTFDIYKNLKFILKENYNAQCVTNAWYKFYEILHHFNIAKYLKNTFANNINVFFNAEFPGAGLCATNHYLNNNNIKYDWIASSFLDVKNEHTTILQDTYGIYKNNKTKWLMSENNNGDMTNINNILAYKEKIKDSGISISLYTHDAGIDVESNKQYVEQELLNGKLHLGCALMGLMSLDKGGVFLAKQYTCFEQLTIDLIIIYTSLFDTFYLVKPATSRPYNSEIYLFGIGFKGMSQQIETELINKMKNYNQNGLLKCDLVKNNIEIINFINNVFIEQQINYINEKIYYYENILDKKQLKELKELNFKKCIAWIKNNKIKEINSANHIKSNIMSK